MLKLNCGSGVFPLKGWVNLDADALHNPDVVVDLGKHLPYDDASVDFIHSEDFLCCLPSFDEVNCFLRESRRVLKPSGVMRLLVPSLERLVTAYLERPQWLIKHWNRAVGIPLIPETAGHLVNAALKILPGFIFDRTTLDLVLTQNRFAVREVTYGESAYPELRGIDDRKPGESISMYLECDPV